MRDHVTNFGGMCITILLPLKTPGETHNCSLPPFRNNIDIEFCIQDDSIIYIALFENL